MEKIKVKLGDNSSLNKQKVREERKLIKKRRLEILKQIDDLLKSVFHIKEITSQELEHNNIDIKDKKVLEKIFILKEELELLSRSKSYKVIGNTLMDEKIINYENELQMKQDHKNNYKYQDNYITKCKDIDKVLTPIKAAEMKKNMTLKELADNMKIDPSILKIWFYRRGANKITV